MTDTVSVVLPTRNRCAEMLSTIVTVLASTHEDLMLRVFNNNATEANRDAELVLGEVQALKIYIKLPSPTPPIQDVVRISCRRSVLVKVRSSGPLQKSVGQQ